MGAEKQLLVDEVNIAWVHLGVACVWLNLSRDDLKEGALPTSIFADKGENATRFRFKRNLVHGLRRAECFAEPLDDQHRLFGQDGFHGFGIKVVLGDKHRARVDLLFDLLTFDHGNHLGDAEVAHLERILKQ